MNYVTGIKWNGERLRFERWVYEAWRNQILRDPDLLAVLRECVGFRVDY